VIFPQNPPFCTIIIAIDINVAPIWYMYVGVRKVLAEQTIQWISSEFLERTIQIPLPLRSFSIFVSTEVSAFICFDVFLTSMKSHIGAQVAGSCIWMVCGWAHCRNYVLVSRTKAEREGYVWRYKSCGKLNLVCYSRRTLMQIKRESWIAAHLWRLWNFRSSLLNSRSSSRRFDHTLRR